MIKRAVISDCGHYRYRLDRIWDDRRAPVCWVMCNPSTADADDDDPTIRKCIGFARRWEHGSIIVVNVLAWRVTNPRELRGVDDPVGPDNGDHIAQAMRYVVERDGAIVAAWGRALPARFRAEAGRTVREIEDVIKRPVWCLGITKEGQPRHPLMLNYASPLQEF